MCAENWNNHLRRKEKTERQKMTFYWSYSGREEAEGWTSIKPVLFLHSRGHSPFTQSSAIVSGNMKVPGVSHVQLFVTPWTIARQALLSMELSRPAYWSG